MTHLSCVNHNFCDAVLNFRISSRRSIPECEAALCCGHVDADVDERDGRSLSYSYRNRYHRRPNVAQHASYDPQAKGGEGSIVLFCSECMSIEVQQFPPNTSWRPILNAV